MYSNKLPVFGIDRIRIGSDGKGVRTLIGAYGCPLQCKYCINPESTNPNCAPYYYSKEELYEEIKIDSLYFQATNGGLTFGGGEPLLYADFIHDFIKEYCQSWSTYIETSLYVPLKSIRLLENVVDKFVVDIKDINPQIYKEYTGMDNDIVIENLKYLVNNVSPDRLIVRVPYIKEYNTEENISDSIEYLKNIGIKYLDYFKYRVKDKAGGQ